jgi:hypothetical protein
MRKRTAKKILEEAEEVNSSILSYAKSNKIPDEYFEFISVDAHPAVVSACRKLLILGKSFGDLAKDICTGINSIRHINNSLSKDWNNSALGNTANYTLNSVGLWSPEQPKQSVVFFPNLWVKPMNVQSINLYTFKDESPIFPNITSRLNERIKFDIAHNRTESWFPFHRGIKRLGANHKVTLSSYLAKSLSFKGELLKSMSGGGQVIDAITTRVLELYQPSEFCFADDVKTMREMYTISGSETPTSCMDSTHTFGLYYDRARSETDKANPVDFYAHCSVTRGAFIKRGSTVLARTICWHDTLANQWYYGRVYGNRTAYQNTLTNHLKDEGFRAMSSDERAWFPGRANHNYNPDPTKAIDEFTIPHSYDRDGNLNCVMPYMDRMPFYSVSLKDNGNNWTCYINHSENHCKGDFNPDVRATNGCYYPDGEGNDDYTYCENCDADQPYDDMLHAQGYHFCDIDCAIDYGMVLYIQSENSRWTYRDDLANADCVRPAFGQPAFFSNYKAAVNNPATAVYRPSMFAETEIDFFCYTRRIAVPWISSGLDTRVVTPYNGSEGYATMHPSKRVVLAESKKPQDVLKQVSSNMSVQDILDMGINADSTELYIRYFDCTRHVEDNLHVKQEYAFISSTSYINENMFEYDMEKEDKATFDAMSHHLGNLPNLVTGELPKLKQFVTFNKGDNQ